MTKQYKRDSWQEEDNFGKTNAKRKAPKKPKYGLKKEIEEDLDDEIIKT